MATTFNRREFIKLTGGALAAFSIPPLFASCGTGSSSSRSAAPIQRDLHFQLTQDAFLDSDETFQLHVAGTHYTLTPHDAASRAHYGIAEGAASHYATTVTLPGDRAIHIYVTQRTDKNGAVSSVHGAAVDHGLALTAIHVPPSREIAADSSALHYGGAKEISKISLDPTVSPTPTVTPDPAESDLTPNTIDTFSPSDIAAAIIFHHSNLTALDADLATTVLAHIRAAEGFNDLAAVIKGFGRHNWYTMQPMVGDDDQPATRPADGTVVYQYIVRDEVMNAGQRALASALNAVHNDPALQNIFYSGSVLPADEEQPASSDGLDESGKSSAVVSKNDASASDGLMFTLARDGRQTGLSTSISVSSGRQVTLTFKSYFLRHLSVFVEFLDASGDPVTPDSWTSQLTWADSATQSRLESDSTRFLTLLVPPSLLLGGPVRPSESEVTFTFPANASQMRILAGGLGNGGERNAAVEEVGVALTSTFELGVPSILLAAAAGYHNNPTKIAKLYKLTLASDVVQLFFSMIWSKSDHSASSIMQKAAIFLGNMVLKRRLQDIMTFIIEEETESAALDAVPFVGWALNAVAIAVTAAQLAQTSAEVASSPWIIQNRLTVTHTIVVVISRDPKDYQFPATATHFQVTLNFSGTDTRTMTVQLPGTTVSEPQSVTFTNVPAGGMVSGSVHFYSDNDWICGRADITAVQNLSDTGQSQLTLHAQITEQLVPLTETTLYHHKQKSDYVNGGYVWQSGSAPTATRLNLSSQVQAGSLASLGRISVNQTLGRASYSWQSYSGGVASCNSGTAQNVGYAYRTLGLSSNPNQGMKSSSCYDNAPTLVENSLITDSLGVGPNLLVAPAGEAGYSVTQFPLSNDRGYSPSGILGVFPIRPDIVRRVTGGVLMGISRAYQKIFHLTLAGSPTTIDQAPQATLLSGPALSQETVSNNPSLLLAPVTMAVGNKNTLLILEIDPSNPGKSGTLRAFNSEGNPIGYFGDSQTHGADLRDPGQSVTYLDMATEEKGYIYILSYENQGSQVDQYVLDIYKPDGSHLTTTRGVSAANFALDSWRNVYTLNFEALHAVLGASEPSISEWIPSTP